MRRENIRRDGYNNALNNPEQLRQDIRVEFLDQEGVDAGALKLDYLEMLLHEIDANLFIAHSTRRIPRRDWGLEQAFEVAGVMLAHSLLLGGPAFTCLCPALYSYMVFGNTDMALADGLGIEDTMLVLQICWSFCSRYIQYHPEARYKRVHLECAFSACEMRDKRVSTLFTLGLGMN